MPDQVQDADVPKTAQGLLDWAKANPHKFIYARPANSGPGRTFMMGLPYLLGDSNPKDPVKGWDKTWAYLKELGQYIEYYPSGTGALFKELGEGTRAMTVTTTGWDINPRVLGTVPAEAKVAKLDGFHWVSDAHYMIVPKGIGNDKLAVLLDMMKYMLTPAAQAVHLRQGLFLPGPGGEGRAAVDGAARTARTRSTSSAAPNMPTGSPTTRSRRRCSPPTWYRRSTSGTSRSAAARSRNKLIDGRAFDAPARLARPPCPPTLPAPSGRDTLAAVPATPSSFNQIRLDR